MPKRSGSDDVVHQISWASQPDLQFWCDSEWSTPKWGTTDDQYTEIREVYVADDDRLYTFNSEKVTCPACKGKK